MTATVDHKPLHGRLVNGMSEHYQLPSDNPEMERLTRQHRMIKLGMGGLVWPQQRINQVLAPSPGTVKRILDVGSGSGVWAVEMAECFPHVEILGIDLVPPVVKYIPPNCRFEIANFLEGDLVERWGTFDVVHCRNIGAGLRSGHKAFVQKAVNLVKKGGIISLMEGSMIVYNEKKEPIRLAQEGEEPGRGSWLARILDEWTARDKNLDEDGKAAAQRIPGWLRSDPRLKDVQDERLFCGIGWRGNDDVFCENKELVGQLMALNALDISGAFQPMMLSTGVSKEQYDLWVEENRRDVEELRIKSYGMLGVSCATRV
ncbi:hypothetical protein FRC03_005452 [Tulasnella sp. 419]|nr:hypothetical protein FRC03_005452 [Tulasnella sp. 419]